MRDSEAAPARRPKIYVVDSDRRSREQIEEAIATRGGFIVACDSLQAFLSGLQPNEVGAVLLDLDVRLDAGHHAPPQTPHYGGLAALRQLHAFPCPPPVILLAENPCWRVAVESMKLGCLDILSKPIELFRLLDAVSHALQKFHSTWLHRERKRETYEKLGSLTASEKDVLHLLCEGYLNKQIAARLSLSVRTIELRRAKILTKMGVASLGQLIQMVSSVDWKARAVG